MSTPQATQAAASTSRAPAAPQTSAAVARPTEAPHAPPAAATAKAPLPQDESAIPGWIKQALKFNPMTGLVRSFRAALLGHRSISWTHLGYSAVIVLVTFVGGCFYFHRVEDSFADII